MHTTMNMMDIPTTQALVPVMVNAGVAVLPAIGAALLTVVGALLRPKLLLGLLMAAALAFGLWAVWPTHAQTDTRRPPGERTAEEWVAFAMQIQRFGDADSALGVNSQPPSQGSNTNTTVKPTLPPSTTTDGPVIFRLNNQRNGHAGGQSPVNLKPVWNWQDPEDEFAMYPASVVVQGDWVYGAGVSLSPPDSYGTVFAINAKTGKERWVAFEGPPADAPETTAMFKGIYSSPAVTADGKNLVVGQGLHPDYNSSLLCFDTATGALRWAVPTPLHVESSPAIDGDLAVAGAGAVEVGAEKKIKPGDNPGYVLAVRISDGETLWTHQVNDPESSPIIKDGVVYIGSGYNGNAVVALRTETDEQLAEAGLEREIWRAPTPQPATGAVTLAGDQVLIGCATGTIVQPGDEGSVLALDRETGEELWRTDPEVVRGAVFAPVAVRGNIGIVAAGNGEVIAIDLDNQGALLWRARPNDTTPVLAGVAYTDQYVYAVTNDGRLTVLNAEDGSYVEHHFLNRPDRPGELRLSVSGPIVRDNRLYVGSETGGVHCFRGADDGVNTP